MKIRFTAEIIDDDENIIERHTGEEDGIPSLENIDISTKEGFLRDFDIIEKAILNARNKVGEGITDGIYEAVSKKNERIS